MTLKKSKIILSAKQLTPLIEIILTLAFFAGVSTILLQIFAGAHNNSRLAHDINNATLFVGECAERIRTADHYDAVSDALYLRGFEKAEGEHVYLAYLDGDFASAPKDKAYSTVTFEASVTDAGQGRLLTGQFVCTRRDGKELFRAETAVFFVGDEKRN